MSTAPEEFPDELREIATSLGAGSPEDVLPRLTGALDARLADSPEKIVADWSSRDALRGRTVRWQGGQGTATGIDESGALLVDTSSGRVKLDAGEVHLLG